MKRISSITTLILGIAFMLIALTVLLYEMLIVGTLRALGIVFALALVVCGLLGLLPHDRHRKEPPH